MKTWPDRMACATILAAGIVLAWMLISFNAGCVSDRGVAEAARGFGDSIGSHLREWKPIDVGTARALGGGIRPEVRVIDRDAAEVIGGAVERVLTRALNPSSPPPGVPTTTEFWGGIGALIGTYGVTQIVKRFTVWRNRGGDNAG